MATEKTGKYRVNKTFRDEATGKWYIQGQVIEILISRAADFVLNRLLAPIVEAITNKIEAQTEAKPESKITRRQVE